MDAFDAEIGAIVDLAKDLVAAGEREAAGVLLKSSIEPLAKTFEADFLAETAQAAREVAKSRGIPFDTQATQRGAERKFIFKTGYHEVEHLRHGNDVRVTIRKTVEGPVPTRDLALAKAISVKLQRIYTRMGDTLLAKTEELFKGKKPKREIQAGEMISPRNLRRHWQAKPKLSPEIREQQISGAEWERRMDTDPAFRERYNRRVAENRDAAVEAKEGVHEGVKTKIEKAKVDEKKTIWIAEKHVPKTKRLMRQTRKEAPGDPLAAKKPGSMLRPKGHAIERHLKKGDVVSMDPSKRKKPIEAPAAESAPAPVIGALRPPEEHLDAMKHHVAHLLHHNLHADYAEGEGRDRDAALHSDLADKHYAHALSHANRIGRGKHDIAFFQGEMQRAMEDAGYDVRHDTREHLHFRPHPADAALGGKLVDPKKFTKSDAFLNDLAKALKRRRPPRTKRALGRHKRTRGVWAERSKLRGKQSQQQVAARRQTQATQPGILGSLLGTILGS